MPTMESIGFASDEQGIAHDCVEEPVFNNDGEPDTVGFGQTSMSNGSVPPSKFHPAPPAPATQTSKSNTTVPPSNSPTERPPVVI